MQEDGGYQPWNDPRFKSLALNLGVFVLILLASSRCVEFLINKYMMNDQKATASDLATATTDQTQSVFKSENEVDDELTGSQKISPADLKREGFFGKGRNFFVIVK